MAIDYSELKIGQKVEEFNRTIKEIISKDKDHIVYIDEHGTICTSNDLSFVVTTEFGKIQNRISYWESVCNRVFSKKEALDLKCLLAEGYARMYESNDFNAANEIINDATKRIEVQGKQILRQDYLIASLYCTLVIITLLIFSILFKDFILRYLSKNVFHIYVTALFGGIGAFVSTMIRARKYKAEISSSRRIHMIDGSLRVFYGLIASLLIALGIKANLLLGFINATESNVYVLFFMGAIGGASEWFLPNIIKQFEKNENPKLVDQPK